MRRLELHKDSTIVTNKLKYQSLDKPSKYLIVKGLNLCGVT
jgi:hypothetical protein